MRRQKQPEIQFGQMSAAFVILSALAAGCAAPTSPEPPTTLEIPNIIATPIALNEDDATQDRSGQLRYRGGLHLDTAGQAKPGQRFGGHSSLYWREGRLWTVMDHGLWSSFEPVEEDGVLVGIADIDIGNLRDTEGGVLNGKADADAEALTVAPNGDWLVAFERDHRVWRYDGLSSPAAETTLDPLAAFDALPPNKGIEALASLADGFVMCAERAPDQQPPCAYVSDGSSEWLPTSPPAPLDELGGAPTDIAAADDETLYFLFRSYSPADGSGGAIVARAPDGEERTLAVFRPPLSVDNFEGIAVRNVGERKFLYLITDNNFSSRQRTLLMKFEVLD